MTPNSVDHMRNDILADFFFGDAVKYISGELGDVRNRVLLDSGCGNGEMTVFFASQGATVMGIDKDKMKMNKARDLAESYGLRDSCTFLHELSEETSIPTGSVDIIFSRSTIQYMDKERLFREYLRILKPGGSVALLENLPLNPFVNMYRLVRRIFAGTEEQREYINSIKGYITNSDIDYFGANFVSVERREFHLFHMIIMYMKLSKTNRLAKKLDIVFSCIDTKLLESFPFLRKFAWFTAVHFKGRNL